MKDIKETFNLISLGTIAVDILVMILGIFLMTNPAVGYEGALILIGILLLISGISSVIKYIIHPKRLFRFILVYGLLCIIAGLFAIFKPIDMATLITILIATWLIISSAVKLIIALELRKSKDNTWTFDLTVAVLAIILGILMIFNPFSANMIITIYAGVMMIIYSGMDIVEQFFIRKRINNIIKVFSK